MILRWAEEPLEHTRALWQWIADCASEVSYDR